MGIAFHMQVNALKHTDMSAASNSEFLTHWSGDTLSQVGPIHLHSKTPLRANPGPGLGIRVLGEVTVKQLIIAREADHIFISELRAHGLYEKTSQAFAALIPTRAVGVMGDKRLASYLLTKFLRLILVLRARVYGQMVSLRAVRSFSLSAYPILNLAGHHERFHDSFSFCV